MDDSAPERRIIHIDNRLIIGVVIILVLGLSYWFVARPYFVRRTCERLATNAADYGNPEVALSPTFSTDYQGDYQLCTNARGL